MQRFSRTARSGTSDRSSRRHTLANAAKCLTAVLRGQPLDRALTHARTDPDRAKIFAICYGSLRHFYSLRATIRSRLTTPEKELDPEILTLLLAGLYQQRYMRAKPHAIVSESVEATRLIGKSSASGLVNAILRGNKEADTSKDVEAKYEMPAWFIDAVKQSYPDEADEILTASNQQARLALRINRHRVDLREYKEMLKEREIKFEPGLYRNCVVLQRAIPTKLIPGYEDGLVTVQDAHSQIAAHLLALKPGETVLDACAAPGIKSLQMLEMQSAIELTSVDINEKRTTWFTNEATRLGIDHTLKIVDATSEAFPANAFDKILVDAPCSGTGTLRRHPDIKIHRQPSDVKDCTQIQQGILGNVWSALKPGGKLLYCTCSVLHDENDAIVQSLVDAEAEFESQSVPLPSGLETKFGRQLLPTVAGDGFYFSILTKTSES